MKNNTCSLKKTKSEHVFTDANERKVSCFRKRFKSVLETSGIKDFRFHDLRHTFAYLLIKNGEHPMLVQKLMRHKSLDRTLRSSHLPDKEAWKATITLS